MGLLWLFGLQFVAGMTLNLFVKLPATVPGANGGYFSNSWANFLWAVRGEGGPALMAHALLGTLLFLGTLAFFLICLAAKAHGWRWPSGIASLFTLAALFNGLSFVDYGHDFSSMIMASCWLVAVSLLVFLVARAAPEFAISPGRDNRRG